MDKRAVRVHICDLFSIPLRRLFVIFFSKSVVFQTPLISHDDEHGIHHQFVIFDKLMVNAENMSMNFIFLTHSVVFSSRGARHGNPSSFGLHGLAADP